MWDPRTIQAGPTWGPRTHVLFMRLPMGPTFYLGGTHILFRWDPHTVQASPRTIQVGPTYYSVGTRAYYFVGPTVGPFSLKKYIFLPLFENTKYI